MNDQRKQRVALVTGGAVRLGRAISLGLAKAGYDLVISYHSSSAEAQELADAVENLGRRCVAAQADLARPAAPAALATQVSDAYGRLDLLVNSAASFINMIRG